MRMTKKIVSIALIATLVFSSFTVFAQSNSGEFSDVPSTSWANEDIKFMTELGIIDGYDDGTFLPNNSVSRAEFSKMMVLTLGLSTEAPSTPFFADVDATAWFCPYVESARGYLTGFRLNNKDYFRPNDKAVREDMAVAIVLGLGLSADTNEAILDEYSDKGSISSNLRPYVARAISEGIMIGSNGSFNAQEPLTRAEAATLLTRLIKSEKVVYATEAAIETNSSAPILSAVVRDSDIVLEWTQTPSEGFQYYKIVASKYDSTPSYPENGYIKYIDGVSNTRTEIDPYNSINGGDSSQLTPSENYYFAITAVYEDGKYTSNVSYLKVPGEAVVIDSSSKTPELTATVRDHDILLKWTPVNSSNFKYYKVVASRYDSTPAYPENGYIKYFSSASQVTAEIEPNESINSADSSYLQPGEDYYLSITAVYNDGNYTSNVQKVIVPGEKAEEINVSTRTPVLELAESTEGLKLEWSNVSSENFKYYKIVLSKGNSAPAYPTDGYLTYISNASTGNYFISGGSSYNGGDVGGKLVSGQEYYVSITAVYNDGTKYYTSNTLKKVLP